jgi:hypothetical protein
VVISAPTDNILQYIPFETVPLYGTSSKSPATWSPMSSSTVHEELETEFTVIVDNDQGLSL